MFSMRYLLGGGVLVLYFVLSLIVLVQRFPVLYPVCVSAVLFMFHCVRVGSVMETLLSYAVKSRVRIWVGFEGQGPTSVSVLSMIIYITQGGYII